MSKPAVSIILARKSDEDDLSALLNSLHAQTFTDYQIVISETHDSPAVALNKSVEGAQGNYLAFMDADHLWAPTKLEKQLLKLNENPDVSWCYCDALIATGQTRFNDGAALYSGDILRPLLLKNFIPPGTVVIARSTFQALGGFNESDAFRHSEEWELWIRAAAVHPVGLVDEPLVYLPPDTTPSPREQLSRKQVVESAVESYQDRLKDLRSESLAEICISSGNAHLKANQRNQARLDFEEALTHSPLRSDAYLSWVSSFLSSEAQQQIRDLHNLSRQLQRTEKSKTGQKVAGGG